MPHSPNVPPLSATISVNAPKNSLDKYLCSPGSPPISPMANSVTSQVGSKLECDYDKNPTLLYEAIQDKQWKYAINLLRKEDVEDQARTWVVRKERNGKLRWRLLPLHAAVIFGSPVKLVEGLLEAYPEAAQCKDDQGMLPLHLCFRNESTWDIADELLTAFPQAIFVSDRKGRTPLQCAIQMVSSSSSVASFDLSRPESKAFRSVVNVLDMYSQIAVSAERQKVQAQSKTAAEGRIGKLQDTHLSTLSNLKKEWQAQQEDAKKQMKTLKERNKQLEDQVESQTEELAEVKSNELKLKDEVQILKLALSENRNQQKVAMRSTPTLDRTINRPSQLADGQDDMEDFRRTNAVLRTMMEDMVAEQRAYQTQFQDLMSKYELLVDERKQLQKTFITKTQEQHKKESLVVTNFKEWMKSKEKTLEEQSVCLEDDTTATSASVAALEEEKKADGGRHDSYATQRKRRSPPPPSIAVSDLSNRENSSPIIDLSNMASPRDDTDVVVREGVDHLFSFTPSMD